MIQVKKTTYEVEGSNQPCFVVTDGFTEVRISKFYHYLSKDILYIRESIDGEYNSSEEINGDFDSLTEEDAKRIALDYSVYLTH